MVATDSQIATMRKGFTDGLFPSDVADSIDISEKTVRRYFKKFEGEGLDRAVLIPYPRVRRTESVQQQTNGTIHQISRELTISQLCRRLEETEGLYRKAISDSARDPTLSYLIVKHNETMLDIIKEMGKYCGLNKGTVGSEGGTVKEVKVVWS